MALILSYSLDVGHVILRIFFFLILCFHILILSFMIFSALVTTLIRVQNLSQTAHFSYYNPAVFVVKRNEIFSKLIKFKYEII
jgi:hypothetical protein